MHGTSGRQVHGTKFTVGNQDIQYRAKINGTDGTHSPVHDAGLRMFEVHIMFIGK